MKVARKVAVTGPNGWIAKAFLEKLQTRAIAGVAIQRSWLVNKSESTLLAASLQGCLSVVHLAALVHQMNTVPTIEDYRKVNCALTLQLAIAAAHAGVAQFIFVSTAKVMGERSARPFTEADAANPRDPYSISKLDAENELIRLKQSGELGLMKVVIVRPPLVYGEGVKANYAKLTSLAQTSYPLPLGCATALRSMVSVDHLTDGFIALINAQPSLNNVEIFFATDENDQSTASIVQSIRAANGRRAALIHVPTNVMRLVLSCVSKKNIYERLFTSLQFDGTRLNALIKRYLLA
jgi:nucleoside-diphosphate-sugar epimerase